MYGKYHKLSCLAFVLLAFVSVLIFGPEKESLSEVPTEEALYRIVNGERQAFMLPPYRNAQGLPLNEAESKLLNEGKLIRRYYQDKDKKIKEVRCCKMSPLDTIQEYRLTKLLSDNPLSKIDQITIDCSQSNMAYIYNRLFPEEPIALSEDTTHFYRFKERDNKTILISVIEQCGFPFLEETVSAAHEIILYSGYSGLAEYYYQHFRVAHSKGLLSDEKFTQLVQKIDKKKRFSNKSSGNSIELKMADGSFFKYTGDTIDQVKIAEIIAKMKQEGTMPR